MPSAQSWNAHATSNSERFVKRLPTWHSWLITIPWRKTWLWNHRTIWLQSCWQISRNQLISIKEIGFRQYHSLIETHWKLNSLYSLFLDREPPGWVAWTDSIALYVLPSATKSTFQPWDPTSNDALEALRETAMDSSYWEKLAGHYSEENHETVITQDNVSCVKSICE